MGHLKFLHINTQSYIIKILNTYTVEKRFDGYITLFDEAKMK